MGGGSIRVINVTSALRIGVNYPDVTYVIHFGAPCKTLEGHIQQLGRSGRNEEVAHDIVIYTARGLCNCNLEVRKNLQRGWRLSSYSLLSNVMGSFVSLLH